MKDTARVDAERDLAPDELDPDDLDAEVVEDLDVDDDADDVGGGTMGRTVQCLTF